MQVFEIKGESADRLFAEACWKFKHTGVIESTRGGNVVAQPTPSMITLTNPRNRILYNADRDANPFFHLMESIWMWAGRDDVEWIQQFSSGIGQFAEDDGHFHGAYGWRWRNLFEYDQLTHLAAEIAHDPTSRRHVLQMWTGDYDADSVYKDIPCNTQILWRSIDGKSLDMTVINRSNDLVWGALGANIVHMTMLHELMASAAGLDLGIYRVVSNNLHVYERHWELMGKGTKATEEAGAIRPLPRPLFHDTIDLDEWLGDAEAFCHGLNEFIHPWFIDVALPMKRAYLDRQHRNKHIKEIKCPAWQEAAQLWTNRRK